MVRILTVISLSLSLVGCVGAGPKTHTASDIYQSKVAEWTPPSTTLTRTPKQEKYIAKKLRPALQRLSDFHADCANYDATIEAAETTHRHAVKVLGQDDPQAYRPLHYAFEAACKCGHPADVQRYGQQLVTIQTKVLGADSPDVKDRLAKMAKNQPLN